MSLLRRLAPRSTSLFNLAWDVIAVQVAFAASVAASRAPLPPFAQLALFALGVTLVWTVGGFILRFYDPWANRLALDDAAMLSLLVVGETLALALAEAVVPGLGGTPRIAHFAVILWALVVGPRLVIFRRLARRELPLDEVLVVGIGPLGRCTLEDLDRAQPRRKVAAFLRFKDEPELSEVGGVRVLSTADNLDEVLRTVPVSEVYIAGQPTRHSRDVQAAIQTCERFGMPFALPACPFRLGRARVKHPGAVRDGYLHFVHVRSDVYQAALKRLFDIAASTAALVALAPLFLVVAALIKLTSRGPVFFKQVRVGLHGRPFHMFKFRSMVVDAEALKEKLAAQNEQTGPVFKIKNDPRITPIGRFIRKYSIDELPQLINVLRGEMSIVGPRPPVPKEVAQYEAWQRRRLSVRPGLTCIWQVSGRNQISFEEWMYLDMQYIDHWSLGQDLSLIFRTVPVVITGRGAS